MRRRPASRWSEPFGRTSRTCHCEFCKRIAGGYGTVRREGAHGGRTYASSRARSSSAPTHPDGGSAKTFCSTCGSNLFGGGWPESETSSVRLSSFGLDYDRQPQAHTFVRSVAAWEILPEDGLPRYEIRAT